jgi:tetratricopeptide (TPR) repeat protein
VSYGPAGLIVKQPTASLILALVAVSVLLSASEAPAQAGGAADRSDGLIDAGIDRYRAGAYREAVAILNSVVATRPDSPAAQLYLSLSYLKLGEDALAQRHLAALRDLPTNPRLRAQVDIVLEGLRAGPVSPPLRQFIASSLDETMSLERSPRRPPFADSLLRLNFPYFP